MERVYRLVEWHLQSIGCRVVAFGSVSGHPIFSEKQRIHTSFVTGSHILQDGTICIETYVGNSYLLDPKTQNQKKLSVTRHSQVLLEQWLERREKRLCCKKT